jgi:hypothetical protein
MIQRPDQRRWFRRHPGGALFVLNGALLALPAIVVEVGLRFYIPYSPSYHTVIATKGRDLEYPDGSRSTLRDFRTSNSTSRSPTHRLLRHSRDVWRECGIWPPDLRAIGRRHIRNTTLI